MFIIKHIGEINFEDSIDFVQTTVNFLYEKYQCRFNYSQVKKHVYKIKKTMITLRKERNKKDEGLQKKKDSR